MGCSGMRSDAASGMRIGCATLTQLIHADGSFASTHASHLTSELHTRDAGGGRLSLRDCRVRDDGGPGVGAVGERLEVNETNAARTNDTHVHLRRDAAELKRCIIGNEVAQSISCRGRERGLGWGLPFPRRCPCARYRARSASARPQRQSAGKLRSPASSGGRRA